MWALFMPAFIGALAMAMGSLAGRVLIALGFGFVTYTGIDLGIGAMKQMVVGGLQGMSADIVGLIGYLWIDKAISVIFSAIGTAIMMRALGGSVKRMIAK